MCIAEIITIIANEITLSPHFTRVLSALFLSGSAQNISLTQLSAVGIIFIAFGTLLAMQCHRVMKHLFTLELSIRIDHNLITTGPYNHVRHPGYASLLAVYIGMFCWFGARGSWLRESGILDTMGGCVFFGALATTMVGLLIALFRRMRVEDEALREVFGYEWVEWAERVPYSLIPYVY
jgi:protein-S-isoprenylcysteine O-methyltransferase Ste14